MVIFVVIRERYLRTVTNYFIVSLATADLFMGAIVMPFAVIVVITDDYWPFGQVWCYLWNALDVLSSTASILNLCMIALERYWAIENPISHSTRITKRWCIIIVICVWLCSSAISFPAILWWRVVSETKEFMCIFTDNAFYLISSSIVSFYAPLVVMIVVYYRIYLTASTLIRNLNAGTKVIYKSGQQGEPIILRIHRGGLQETSSLNNIPIQHSINNLSSCDHPRSSSRTSMQNLSANYKNQECNQRNSSHYDNTLYPPLVEQKPITSSRDITPISANRDSIICEDPVCNSSSIAQSNISTNVGIANKLRHFELGKRLSKFGREQKAAKTLGIVMGIFIICWLPFFICNIIVAFDNTIVNVNILKVVTWLGYINSGVNPIVYAHSMRDFRRAFIKLLCRGRVNQRLVAIFNLPRPSTTSTHFQRNSAVPADYLRRSVDFSQI